jgi:hypothetical protein
MTDQPQPQGSGTLFAEQDGELVAKVTPPPSDDPIADRVRFVFPGAVEITTETDCVPA